jgi:hypothetical protein
MFNQYNFVSTLEYEYPNLIYVNGKHIDLMKLNFCVVNYKRSSVNGKGNKIGC